MSVSRQFPAQEAATRRMTHGVSRRLPKFPPGESRGRGREIKKACRRSALRNFWRVASQLKRGSRLSYQPPAIIIGYRYGGGTPRGSKAVGLIGLLLVLLLLFGGGGFY